MTEEQKNQFDMAIFHSCIYENTNEYYTAKKFFELGLKLGKDENQ